MKADLARQAELQRLGSEVDTLAREVADLRGSMSWKVTRPLRVVYGWLLRLRGQP